MKLFSDDVTFVLYHQVTWKQKNHEYCMYDIFVYLYVFLLLVYSVNVYIATDSDLCRLS